MLPIDLPIVTAATFEDDVIEPALPVMVYVWSATCAPCVVYTPIIEVLSDTFSRQARTVKLVAEDNLSLLRHYGVFGAPALLLFNHGLLLDRLIGLYHQREIALRFATVVEMDPERAAAQQINPGNLD